MPDLPPAHRILRVAPAAPAVDTVTLTQADRAIRVRALTTARGDTFIVDLPERQSLDNCFGFELEDGRVIEIVKAREPVLEVRGDITRYAWHLGAVSAPCQIDGQRLLTPYIPEVARMLEALGATIQQTHEAFSPEALLHPDHDGHGPHCDGHDHVHLHHGHDTASHIQKPVTGDPF